MSEKILRQWIREVLDAKSAQKLVGKYLWPKERGLDVDEPNTDYENKLFKSLIDSIASEFPMSQEQINTIKDLADTGKYSDILKYKTRGRLYRGITVTNSWFEQSFGLSSQDAVMQSEVQKVSSYEKAYKLPADLVKGIVWGTDGALSSWTTNFKSTLEFAYGYAARDRKSTRLNSSHVSESRMPSSA